MEFKSSRLDFSLLLTGSGVGNILFNLIMDFMSSTSFLDLSLWLRSPLSPGDLNWSSQKYLPLTEAVVESMLFMSYRFIFSVPPLVNLASDKSVFCESPVSVLRLLSNFVFSINLLVFSWDTLNSSSLVFKCDSSVFELTLTSFAKVRSVFEPFADILVGCSSSVLCLQSSLSPLLLALRRDRLG